MPYFSSCRAPHLWRGAVLSAPALAIDPAVDTPLNRFLASTLADWLPKVRAEGRVGG